MLGKNLDHLKPDKLEDRFSHIYKTAHWTIGNQGIPLSGTGSSLEATETLRAELPKMLEIIQAKSILDVGCGDFTWMKTLNLTEIEYIGIDIVEDVIADNIAKFSGPNVRFDHLNAVEDELPQADVILIREVLFHLSNADIWSVLNNIVKSNPRWILLTSDRLSDFNADIVSGDWRLVNFRKAPFFFPEPSYFIDESIVRPGRHLAVWATEDILPSLDKKRRVSGL